MLRDVEYLILVGTAAPVAFFAYPGKPSLLTPEHCNQLVLATPEHDQAQALEWLADALGIAPDAPGLQTPRRLADRPRSGALTGAAVNSLTAHLLPENAIVCDESITQGRKFPAVSAASAPYDWLQLTGGRSASDCRWRPARRSPAQTVKSLPCRRMAAACTPYRRYGRKRAKIWTA